VSRRTKESSIESAASPFPRVPETFDVAFTVESTVLRISESVPFATARWSSRGEYSSALAGS